MPLPRLFLCGSYDDDASQWPVHEMMGLQNDAHQACVIAGSPYLPSLTNMAMNAPLWQARDIAL